MPFRFPAHLGAVEAHPYVLRTFSHDGHGGFAVTHISSETEYSSSLVVATTPDGRLSQSETYANIPLASSDETLLKLASRGEKGNQIDSLAPFGWIYDYDIVDRGLTEGAPPLGWEWLSRERMSRTVQDMLARVSPRVKAALEAFQHTASFSWKAFDLASVDGETGERRRSFVKANPIVAATALMNAKALANIDRGGGLDETLDAMSTSSKVDGLYGPKPVGKRAVKSLSGLLDRPGGPGDPMSFRGVATAAIAAESLPPEWLPRTHESANAFARVCAFVSPMLGSRLHRRPVDWRFLLSNSKGDWESYLARILDALQAPEHAQRDPVEYLWTIEYEMDHMIMDVMVPLAHRSTGALGEIAQTPYDRQGEGQPDWSLRNFYLFAVRLDMNLPAMVAQAARHVRAKEGIMRVLRAHVRSPTGFGNGYGCPYDLHDDAIVAAMLRAWQAVFPKSWRGKSIGELVIHLDELGERYRESLATRH